MTGATAPADPEPGPDAWGVWPGYVDAFGRWRDVPLGTRERLIAAMAGELPDPPPHRESAAGGRPATCHPPPSRTWGWSVQLYAARSHDSWGIGDLADLRRLARWSRQLGAGVLLVNPLDAPSPLTPRERSPYYPSSRRFRDPVYLRIEEVPGAQAVAVDLAPLAAEGRGLNRRPTLDRDHVWRLKQAALRRIWLDAEGAGQEDGFVAFRDEQGASLERFALCSALTVEHAAGWPTWPQQLRDGDAAALRRALDAHRDDVAFHAWQQWLCDEQLRRAGEQIALLRDLPVGFDPSGADAWEWRELLADGVTIGAPPDQLGPQGQDWGLPALVPSKLQRVGYAPVVETLRSALRHAGGLRIDHVLGLFRLFWIPAGATAADGAYVAQPSRELLDLVASRSREAAAFVVGEDLGTVGAGVRDALRARNLLRYQVWWFEDDDLDGWEAQALASVTTHDLPTVAGIWTGADAAEQARLGLDRDPDWQTGLRRRIAAATGATRGAAASEVTVALHAHLASAPNAVVVAQLEDALGVEARANMPGTTLAQRANWSLALPVAIDRLDDHPVVAGVAGAILANR